MGGKSRKSGGVSKALIDRLKAGSGKGCCNKPKNNKGGFGELSKEGGAAKSNS